MTLFYPNFNNRRTNQEVADEIAKELNPEDPMKERIAAGKKVINSIDKLINQEKKFCNRINFIRIISRKTHT